MFEYKVEMLLFREAEKKMNAMATEGWRVIAVSPNIALKMGIFVTFEREKTDDQEK